MIDSQFLTLFYELMIFTTRHDTTNIAVKQYSTLLVLNQTSLRESHTTDNNQTIN